MKPSIKPTEEACMRNKWPVLVVLMAVCVSLGQAAVTGYVNNPTTNSTDWANAVLGNFNSINFDTDPQGVIAGNVRTYTIGGGQSVKMTVTGMFANWGVNDTDAGPSEAGNLLPTSPGEGPHPAGNPFLGPNAPNTFGKNTAPGTVIFSFVQTAHPTVLEPVGSFGVFVIDLFNPPAVPNADTISVYTGIDGTGTLLGTFTAASFNFQMNNLYFMGVVSTINDIGSVVFTNVGTYGDYVALDNVRFATGIPEPASLALVIGGGLLLFVGWRRRRTS
jgi:hypothetical protein